MRLTERRPLIPALLVVIASLFAIIIPLRAADENGNDTTITTQVKSSLLYHLSLNFQVRTSEGIVTLTGNADDDAEIQRNTTLALKIEGVKRVINNMVISMVVAGSDERETTKQGANSSPP